MKLKKNECALVVNENGEIVSLQLQGNLHNHDAASDGMMTLMAIMSLSRKKDKAFTEIIRKEVQSICRKAKIKRGMLHRNRQPTD